MIDELAGDLEDAGPPDADGQAVGAIADQLREAAQQLRVLLRLRQTGAGRRRVLEPARRVRDAMADVGRRTSSFGFEECEALLEFTP